jgi:curved DNA-binding protein
VRGADLHAELELDFVEAALGGERRITVQRPSAGGALSTETLRVRIPPGVADGGRIRLRGKGGEGLGGGPPGDLWARVRVRAHRVFRRERRDLHLEVPVGVGEAALGAELEVPTLEGRIKLTLPAGTDSGAVLRVRGKGIPAPRGRAPGDLYVHVKIVVPKRLDAAARADFERVARHDPADLRRDLFADEPGRADR